MAATGIVPSKSAARRAIAEGGAYLNNRRMTAPDASPEADLLHGRFLVLRRGKRTVGGVKVEPLSHPGLSRSRSVRPGSGEPVPGTVDQPL